MDTHCILLQDIPMQDQDTAAGSTGRQTSVNENWVTTPTRGIPTAEP